MNKLPLYCSYTSSHAPLFDEWFTPTVDPGFDVHAHKIETTAGGDYMADAYLDAVGAKIEWMLEAVRRHAGEWLVFSDVDIQFFHPCCDRLRELAADSGADLLFQREARDLRLVNSGFFLVHCTPVVIRMMEEMREEFLRLRAEGVPGFGDQEILNQLLGAPGRPTWTFLPWEFYARTHGWPPPDRIVLHHANYTKGKGIVAEKIQQMQEVRDYVASGWFGRARSLAQKIAAKGGIKNLAVSLWRRIPRR